MKKQNFIITLIAIALMMNFSTNAQDTIVKLNHEMILSKIVEVSTEVVKYKKQDNLSGPVYMINKSEINQIIYKNGMVDKFNTPTLYYNQAKANNNKPNGNVEYYSESESKVIDTAAHYIINLIDGTRLKGKLISQNEKEVVLLDNNIGEKKIQRTKIQTLELENGNQVMVITLNDGSIISGKILNQNERYTIVETKDLGVINLPASKIKKISEFEDATVSKQGSIWFKNPNSTRYLFAPSAYQLKKGEGYYQNILGLGNAVQYGITDYATIGGGLVGPFGVYLDTKLGFKVVNNLHVAGGVMVGNSFFPINDHNFGLGLGFGLVTVGNYDHNITFGAGYGFTGVDGKANWMAQPVYTLNGMVRVGKKFALVTENWMVSVKGNPMGREEHFSGVSSHYEGFYSYAGRFMTQRTTFDFGFANTPALIERGNYIGFPFIGFAVRFGKYKDE